jgi:4-amino-4-deoxy-L-arabinose transferase-like glycosyltransferase
MIHYPKDVAEARQRGDTADIAAGDRQAVAHAGQSHRSNLVPLLVLLCLGAAARVGVWLWFAPLAPSIQDEQDYNRFACNLALYGEFAFTPGHLDSIRPPLYPAFVAGVYRVFGLESFQAVRLLQAALSLATVLLVYRIGSDACSPRVGLWAAAICCFYPSLLGFNNLLLTEVLFTFLLCAFCALFIRGLQRSSPASMAGAGALLALAALTRSVVWLFPPVLALFLLLAFQGGWGRRLLAACTLVAAFAAVLAPWAYRNTRLQQTFITVDVMGGRNFMMGNYRYTPLYRSWAAIELDGEKSWLHEVLATSTEQERGTQGKIDKLALRQGLRFVAAHPGLTLQRDVVKFFDFWGLERELVKGANDGSFGPIARPVVLLLATVICGTYVLVLFAGVFGILLAPPADRRVHLFVLLVIAFVCGMHTLVFGHSRYHLPLMPLVMIYAASAVLQWRTLWQRRGWAFWRACAVCLLFIGGWLWEAVVVDWARIANLA